MEATILAAAIGSKLFHSLDAPNERKRAQEQFPELYTDQGRRGIRTQLLVIIQTLVDDEEFVPLVGRPVGIEIVPRAVEPSPDERYLFCRLSFVESLDLGATRELLKFCFTVKL